MGYSSKTSLNRDGFEWNRMHSYIIEQGPSWNGVLQVCRGLCYSYWPFENVISDYFEK